MKVKNLRKKIRRLEARLQEGATKLAKLKRKLEAATTAGLGKTKKKSAVRVGETRPNAKSSTRAEKKRRRLTAKSQVKPAGAKRRKRKLNLSPERRAQLASAMKARWAAKRAAVEANSQSISTN
jgi:hypothetical protein